MFLPKDADTAQAMLRAIQGQQAEQEQQRTSLQGLLGRQQQQGGNLRGLALVASLGSNPLLQGLRQTAEQQGMGLDNAAARTEGRLAGLKGTSMDPLRIIALQRAAQRLQQQKDLAGASLAYRKENDAARAGAASLAATEKAEQRGVKLEGGLRREVEGSPIHKAFQESKVSLQKVSGLHPQHTCWRYRPHLRDDDDVGPREHRPRASSPLPRTRGVFPSTSLPCTTAVLWGTVVTPISERTS